MKAIPIKLDSISLTLVVIGLITLSIGLYRIFPIQFNKQFWTMNGPMMVMLVVIVGFIIGTDDGDLFSQSAKASAILAGKFLPLITLLVLVMGAGGVVTRVYEREITAFITRHHIIGPFVAAVLTPTSNALVSVVESLWKVPSMQPICLYYLQASVLMSFPLFMLRKFGFADGSTIPPRMYVAGILMSLVLLPLIRPIFWTASAVCEYWKK